MAYKKITNIIRIRCYTNIFFLIGFILAGIKLENYFYESEGYYFDPVPANIELVINERANVELILSDLDYEPESTSNNTECVNRFYSYKFSIHFYNRLVQHKYKTLISNYIFHPDINSILQRKSIWHASSFEEPNILI